MAKTGISAFTTQEALNYDAYQDWNYEELNLGTALGGYASSSYITVNNPAKQIVIYPRPGETLAANDNLYIYMNDTLADSTSLAAEAMDNSETDFDVDDGDDFTAGDVILVNAELMYVSSIATNTLTVIRGYGSTVATTHADDSIIWKVGTPLNHGTTHSTNPLLKLGADQLPFTFSGIAITGLHIMNTGAEDDDNDDVAVLSFH